MTEFCHHKSHSSCFLLYVRGALWRLAGERIITGVSWVWLDWRTVNNIVYALCLLSDISWKIPWPFELLFGLLSAHEINNSIFDIIPLFFGPLCFVLAQPLSSIVTLLQGLLAWYYWPYVLLIFLPHSIMLSMVLVTVCGQNRCLCCGWLAVSATAQLPAVWSACGQMAHVRHLASTCFFFFFPYLIPLHPNAV